MKYNNILALTPALLLAACGGSEQTMNEPVEPGYTIYSFPADGQQEVSPKADIVLRFSHAITDENLTSKIQISDGNNTVPFTAALIDGGRSIVLSPTSELSKATDYTISFDGSLEATGNHAMTTPNAVGPAGIQFTTRAGLSGVQSLDSLSAEFAVQEVIPSADGFFRPMDFSTFRLRLTQPIHPDWKNMGGSISLQDAEGNTVPATVLAKGRYITIDPCAAEETSQCGLPGDALTAGQTYSVVVSNLPSLSGNTLNYSTSFTPKDTTPTVILYQEVTDSGLLDGLSEADSQHSILNGAVTNGVTLNSVLMGQAGPSQQTGGLYAELAYAPSFPGDEPVPLRIPKGSVLLSSSLDLKVNGTVPIIDSTTNSIQKTGDIKVTMLSDATGYLYPNPYTDNGEAPRHIKLFMDVSMNAEEAQPNASLSQDLLSVELSGIAIVKNGVLTIDAIGMAEPNLLNQEYADTTIAYHIEADTNSDVQLGALEDRTADTTGPQLVSWMPGPDSALPGDRDQMQRPGDPIVLNFDEALDGDSLAAGVSLFADGTEVPSASLRRKLDGTVVVLNPAGGLQHGVDYSVQINGALTDLAGNSATSQTLTFTLPELANTTIVSPLALTTYPGYPCVTTAVDLASKSHGQCLDAADGGPAGDELPITDLPADRPIVIVFSQSMDPATITSDTFIVEEVTDASTPIGSGTIVSGHLEKNLQRIRFYPDTPWNTESDVFYRYTMKSSTSIGDCADAICSAQDYPLQTDMLTDSEDIGGPDLTIYFHGSAPQQTVYTPLRNLPVRDTDSNYVVDCATLGGEVCSEPFNHEGNDTDGFAPSANAAKLLVQGQTADGGVLGNMAARVGCSTSGADCPRNKFIYQTYALNTEVTGPAIDPDSGEQGVGVLLYPTMLATTSATVYLNLPILLGGEQPSVTGPQILRMRYAKDDPDCVSNCSRNSLIPGIIIETEDGPVFKTEAELFLDAPNLVAPMGATHNLYSYPFTLKLEGPVQFFDDGRMQVSQVTSNAPEITVQATALTFFDVFIPLVIPTNGVNLNFVSNPIKEIPEQY